MNAAARQAVWVVAMGVASAMHVGKLPPAIPVLREALGLSLVDAGFLLAVVQVAGMLLGAPVGMVADRLGPKRVMCSGLCLLALASGAGALAPSVVWLLWSRVFEGLGFLLAVLPAPGVLRRVVHDGRALSTALGFWGAYMPLGAALGLLLGPIAYDLVGWRIAWAVLGMASAFFAWGVATQVALDHDGVKQGAGPSMAERLRTTLSAPGPWCVALAFLVYSGQWLAVVGFLPTIYTGAGWPLLWVGVLSALAAGVNMAGNILAGRLLARGVAPVRLLVLAYLSMALGAYGAFGSGAGAVIQYAAVLLFSAVGGLIPGTLFGLAVRLAPNGFTVSTTVGWVQQLSSLGQFAGPPAVAWVAVEAGGWHHTAWMTGACSLAGVLLAMLLQRLVGGLPPMGPPAAAKAH